MNKRFRAKLVKLNQLANFIDDLPHDRFHMPRWTTKDGTRTHCGTAGCAAGWAVTLFHKSGMHFQKAINPIDGPEPYPVYRGAEGYAAFGLFFGLADYEAKWITVALCSASYCRDASLYGDYGQVDEQELPSYMTEYDLDSIDAITPRHAATRIRQVVRRHDPTVLEEPVVINKVWNEYHVVTV